MSFIDSGYIPVCVSPKWSAALLAILKRKAERGQKASDIWYHRIWVEVSRVVSKLGEVSTLEMHTCQKLAELYYVRYGYIPDSWFGLFPPQDFYHVMARCELDWVCQNLDKISARYRDKAVDLLDEYVAEVGEFKPEWMLIYPH